MFLIRRPPRPGSVPALFLHIQKTAGSAIVQEARQFYGDNLVSHGDCWGRPPERFENIGFVSGHIGYDYARNLMPGRFSFTFLREPLSRVLSMYYFCRSRNPDEYVIYHKASEMNLRNFLEAGLEDAWVRKNIWNNQVWQLAHGYAHLDDRTIADFDGRELLDLAKEHLSKFSFVGFAEDFNADALKVVRALSLPAHSVMPKVNASPAWPPVAEHAEKIRSLLGELTKFDRELYAYALARFKTK